MSHRATCPECSWHGDAKTLNGAARDAGDHRGETGHQAKVEHVLIPDGGEEVESEPDHGLFWAGAPLTVNSELFHIYREETGRSLCGKYRHGKMNETTPVEEGDTWKDGRDCKACSRKADPVEVDDGE